MKKLILAVAALFLISSASAATWHNSNQDITLDAQDDESGVEDTYYCVDQDDTCQPREDGQEYTGTFTLSDEGVNFVRFNSKDRVGNIEDTSSRTVRIDKTTPETSNDYPGGWLNNEVTVNLTCNDPENPDASGCETTEYCVDSSDSCTPNTEGSSISFDTEGVQYLRYRSSDVAGNTESVKSQAVRLDFTDPEINVQKEALNADSMNATVVCTDDQSECNRSSMKIHTSETAAFECPTDESRYDEGSTYNVNQHMWICSYGEDNAGNSDFSDTPVEFSVGTLTTDLTYPGEPGTVVTSVDSVIPIQLDVGNEEADKDRRINVSINGSNTKFSDGSKWEEVTLNGVEDAQFNFNAQPDQPGNSTVTINIREEIEGFTVTEEIEIQARETGSRTGSAGREAPGIGLIQVAVLGLIASSYFIATRN